MSTPIVEARGLTKSFGKVQALAGLDLVAESGQVVAVLGPNGAGKTTFVRSVATLVRPDGGELRVAGIDAAARPEQVRRVIGLAGQYAAVEPAMTGRENVTMVARLYGQTRRQARANTAVVLDQLGLTDAADRPVSTYSGGMRRRLDLGASLVGAPRLLLLDEPTTGLDPRSRNELWEAIRGMVAAGTDVLLTTQYLDEADQLAQRIVIVDKGRVIADGTPDELKSRAGRDVVEIRVRHGRRPGGRGRVARPAGRRGPPHRRRHRPGHHPGRRRPGRHRRGGAGARRPGGRGRRHRPAAPDPRRGLPHPDRLAHRRRRPADSDDDPTESPRPPPTSSSLLRPPEEHSDDRCHLRRRADHARHPPRRGPHRRRRRRRPVRPQVRPHPPAAGDQHDHGGDVPADLPLRVRRGDRRRAGLLRHVHGAGLHRHQRAVHRVQRLVQRGAGHGGGLHRPAEVAARVPHRGPRRPGGRRDRRCWRSGLAATAAIGFAVGFRPQGTDASRRWPRSA